MSVRKVALIALAGFVLAWLSAGLPLLLQPWLPEPYSVPQPPERLPGTPDDYPDPNVTWLKRGYGVQERTSIRGVGVYHGWHVDQYRAGWPVAVLQGTAHSEIISDGTAPASGTNHTTDLTPRLVGRRVYMVPTGVRWGGLVLNWLIWSAVVGVPFVPGGVRRWARRRRGECEVCGYPRTGRGVCPECGSATRSAVV